MSAPLMTALGKLALARQQKAAIDARVKLLRAEFEEAHAGILTAQRDTVEHLAALDVAVRLLAGECFFNTGNKKPAPGVEVKIYQTPEIVDRAAALAWAKSTQMALVPESIDEKALLKIAAATQLPFVYYGEEHKVTIATQLDPAAYVAEVTS